MSRDEQRLLLTGFIDDVRDALLAKAGQWPDDWDGIELRWLAEEAFAFEAPDKQRWGKKRVKEFKNAYIVNNLY
jgi:hypothetical protein